MATELPKDDFNTSLLLRMQAMEKDMQGLKRTMSRLSKRIKDIEESFGLDTIKTNFCGFQRTPAQPLTYLLEFAET